MPKPIKPVGVKIRDLRRMNAPDGYKPRVIKNSGNKRRSIRKGYVAQSNKDIKTISNTNIPINKGNIIYRNGIKNIIGPGHQSRDTVIGDDDQILVSICTMPDGGYSEGGCPEGYRIVLTQGAAPGSGWQTPGDHAPAFCTCLPEMETQMGDRQRGGR